MPPRRDLLRRIAIEIVAEGYEPTFDELVGSLQHETGASHSEARATVLRLLGRGVLRTNFASRIVLGRRSGGGGAEHSLAIVAAVLGIIAAILSIWEIGARNGVFPGPGPIEIIFPSHAPVPVQSGFPTIPAIPTGAKLTAPKATISGNCDSGFTIKWTAVAGAEKYRVEEDGHFKATEDGTSHFIPAAEVFVQHSYTVSATALLNPTSDPSNAVIAEKC
jgi:hypothetical protein